MAKETTKIIGGLTYKKVQGYIPSSTVEEEAVFEQSALFHRFVLHGKSEGVIGAVCDFDSKKYVGTLVSSKGITVFIDSAWESDFYRRLDVACSENTSKLGIASSDLVEYPFVTKTSEDGIVREELNTFEAFVTNDMATPIFASDLVLKLYKGEPHKYKFYKIVDFASAQATYKELFESIESQPTENQSSEKAQKGATIRSTESGIYKPEKVIEKASGGENKVEMLKEMGVLNYTSGDFKDREHEILYKKLCEVESLLKSLSLEKVVKETIEKTLEGYIVTRNIKTYSGKGEFAPAKKRKLTAEQIIELREQGVSVKEIAERAGNLSKQAVYAILNKHKE